MRKLLFSVVFVLGCASTPGQRAGSLRAQLDQLERNHHGQSERVAHAQHDVRCLRADLVSVLGAFEQAAAEYERAEAAYEDARATYQGASDLSLRARQNYEAAARNYKIIAGLLVLAASMDSMGNDLCGGKMRTSAYRRELRAEGIDLEGRDVDHLWPRSLGGIDHPSNYEVIDSSLNRSLGNDVWRKLMHSPVGVIKGLVASAISHLACT